MKKLILILITASLLFYSCVPPDEGEDILINTSSYKPIIMSRSAARSSISFMEPRKISNAGKLTVRDSIVFLNEKYKGYHIINNSDPSSPVNIGFLRVPGSIDMVIKGSFIYADQSVEFLTIDISHYQNPKVVAGIDDLLPELRTPDNYYLPTIYSKPNRPENTIIVDWTTE